VLAFDGEALNEAIAEVSRQTSPIQTSVRCALAVMPRHVARPPPD
jgi:hypothetical protein